MSTDNGTTTATAQLGDGRIAWSAGHHPARRRRSGRVRALLAGGLVLGIGSAATLAAWTDTEWVFGGGGDGGGVGASSFEVEQNVWDGVGGVAQFTNRETQALAGGLVFSPLTATSLSPGDVVYAPMQLRTAVDSVGATVTLRGAVKSAGADDFFGALRYSVRSGVGRAACSAAAFAPGSTTGTPLVTAGSALTTPSTTGAITLAPATADAPGAPVDLCFAVTLPGGSPSTLQGLDATPVWAFDSQSV